MKKLLGVKNDFASNPGSKELAKASLLAKDMRTEYEASLFWKLAWPEKVETRGRKRKTLTPLTTGPPTEN